MWHPFWPALHRQPTDQTVIALRFLSAATETMPLHYTYETKLQVGETVSNIFETFQRINSCHPQQNSWFSPTANSWSLLGRTCHCSHWCLINTLHTQAQTGWAEAHTMKWLKILRKCLWTDHIIRLLLPIVIIYLLIYRSSSACVAIPLWRLCAKPPS